MLVVAAGTASATPLFDLTVAGVQAVSGVGQCDIEVAFIFVTGLGMKTFLCVCQNQLFFGNTFCLACQREAGFCPNCQQMTALIPDATGKLRCGHRSCGAPLQKCHNYVTENVCNWCVVVDDQVTPTSLCHCCRLTEVIPDLTIEGNRELWARLEDAKRRVMFTLNLLNLPLGLPENQLQPKLKFDFAADLDDPVYTGHDEGRITINIREADDVEREKARVAFREPQRTLVGHFRHELGHYFWDLLIKGQQEASCRTVFGDERNPNYDDALPIYYQNGPKPNWVANYVSAYATMHPWEDFAETFGTYLDMISVLDTSRNRSGKEFLSQKCDVLVKEYLLLGKLVNEINREMGLKDLVPEVFNPSVVKKLSYIHEMVVRAAQNPPLPAPPPAAPVLEKATA